jgi:hypothetical protein
VRLVDDEERPGARARGAHPRPVARLRQDDADVGERRLGQHAGDVAALQLGLEGLGIVELDDRGGLGGIDRGADQAFAGTRPAVLQHDEGLVDRAVVAPREHEHAGAARELAAEAQREPVGVGRRERELPLRQAEAPGQLVADPRGVRGREHHRRAAPRLQPLPHRRDRRRRRMTGHRARVAEAQVRVLVPVDVHDPRAARLGQVDREAARPLRHPGHRHPAQQMPLRVLVRGERTRPRGGEPLALVGHQHGEPGPVHVHFSAAGQAIR